MPDPATTPVTTPACSRLSLSLADASALARHFSKGRVSGVEAGKGAGLLLKDVETGKTLLGQPIHPDVAIKGISVQKPDLWQVNMEIKGLVGVFAELPWISGKVRANINQGLDFLTVSPDLRSAVINWQRIEDSHVRDLFGTLQKIGVSLPATPREAVIIEFSANPPVKA